MNGCWEVRAVRAWPGRFLVRISIDCRSRLTGADLLPLWVGNGSLLSCLEVERGHSQNPETLRLCWLDARDTLDRRSLVRLCKMRGHFRANSVQNA